MRAGYIANEVNMSLSGQNDEERAHRALETAYECSKRLNEGLRTKRVVCQNYDQDIAPIGIEFSYGKKLCGSLDIRGQGVPKTIITTDSMHGSIAYEKNIVSMTIPTRRSQREFIYNFNRRKGHTIIDEVVRTEFTYCEDE